MEERIARLESDVAHLRADVSEMKGDIKKLDSKVDTVKDSVASLALATEKSFGELRTNRFEDRVWWLLIGGAILGVLAHGFKWL